MKSQFSTKESISRKKPLQIEIIEDDAFEKPKLPIQEAEAPCAPAHRLSLHNNSEQYSISSSEGSSQGHTTYRQQDTNRNSGQSPTSESSSTLKYRVQLLQEELRKEQKEKEQLYRIVKDMSRKKQELDRLYDEEVNRAKEIQNLHSAANRLKQINKRLEDDLREEREYSKKLEQEIQDVMSYKNTGIKAENYLQRVRADNKENSNSVGNIRVVKENKNKSLRGQV